MSYEWKSSYPEGSPHEIDISGYNSISHRLDIACDKFANKTALSSMGSAITYRQFKNLANQFASYLQNKAGLVKGDRLIIMLPNVMQFPVAFYAAQKIGVVCVATNPLYTPREMRHQFKDCGAKAIVILDMFTDKLEEVIKDTDIQHVVVTGIGDQLPTIKGRLIKGLLKLKGLIPSHELNFVSFKKALELGSTSSFIKPELAQNDVALLQYTGGTTGVSKGAVLLQQNILANMEQIRLVAITFLNEGEEVAIVALPLYHIFSMTVNFLSLLTLGAEMILVPKPVPIKNTTKLFKKRGITFVAGLNTLFNSMNNDAFFQKLAPRTIKLTISGGMSLQEPVANRWQQITGNSILEGFGLTESSPVTHVNPSIAGIRKGSIGIPMASTNAKIMLENEEASYDEVGELVVKGPQIMKEYWNRPEDTDDAIKEGWLWTGDMAKRDKGGYFYIVDRKKDMIIVSGFNVFPNEIEEVLASHPKVLEAAVIGLPDETCGEKVKAFVVKKDESLTETELKSHCREQLTGYKRPRAFEFRDDLPKTNVGKILRRELRPD